MALVKLLNCGAFTRLNLPSKHTMLFERCNDVVWTYLVLFYYSIMPKTDSSDFHPIFTYSACDSNQIVSQGFLQDFLKL